MFITNPDYVAPDETTFDVEKPIRTEQGLMLAGNPIAIVLGKTGAPRLRIGALQRLTAGDELRLDDPEARVTADRGTDETFEVFAFAQKGTVKVTVTWTTISTNSSAIIKRKRAGVVTTLGTSPTETGGPNEFTISSVSVQPGDALLVELNVEVGTGRARIDRIRIYTNGEDLFPGVYAALVNNTYNA